jgi:hypothetical protein
MDMTTAKRAAAGVAMAPAPLVRAWGTNVPPLFTQSLTAPPVLHTLYNAEHDAWHCVGGVGGVGDVGSASSECGVWCEGVRKCLKVCGSAGKRERGGQRARRAAASATDAVM